MSVAGALAIFPLGDPKEERDSSSEQPCAVANAHLQSCPVLNIDILVNVFFFLESQRDILHLMKTCRPLYAHGAHHLLGGRYHNLEVAKGFPSFSRFILDSQDRAWSLNKLNLSGCALLALHQNMAVDLARILLLSTNLQFLTLDQCEAAFKLEPIAEAMHLLTSLMHISLKDVGPVAAMVIRNMQASLIYDVSLTFVDGIDTDPLASVCDPLLILGPFSRELLVLHLDGASFPGLFSNGQHTYHHLHDLVLATTHFTLSTSWLSNALPRLKKFSWGPAIVNEWGDGDPTKEISWEEAVAGRAANEGDLKGGFPQSWEQLDYLYCSISRAFGLALQAEVQRFDAGILVFPRQISQLHTVLLNIRPSMLSLIIAVKNFTLSQIIEITECFSNSDPDVCIEFLNLTLDFEGCALEDIDTLVWLLCVRSLMNAWSTYAVFEILDESIYLRSDADWYRKPSDSQKQVEDKLREVDIEDYMKRLCESSFFPDEVWFLFRKSIRLSELWRCGASALVPDGQSPPRVPCSPRGCHRVEGDKAAKIWEDFLFESIIREMEYSVEFAD